MLLHLIKFDIFELIASWISQRILSLNLKFIKMSFVPLLSLFFMRTIFNFYGLVLLILLIYSYSLRVSFYLEEHLHLNKSPILKERSIGGPGQILISTSECIFLAAISRPWMSLLSYITIYSCRFLTILYENFPLIFSIVSTCSSPFLYSSLWRIPACIS